MKHFLLAAGTLLVLQSSLYAQVDTAAQRKEAAYIKTVTERADKIVAKLNITDVAKATRVRDMVAVQYRQLNDIYIRRDAAAKQLKEKAGAGSKPDEASMKAVEAATNASLDSLHKIYLSRLQAELNEQQVAQVKDGMTYNVLNVTYAAYQDMLPNLTDAQKAQILAWLTEAREHAMDAESSEKKHAWFGKYKGRINNYLSQAGIDMKQAEADWQKRIKERKGQ